MMSWFRFWILQSECALIKLNGHQLGREKGTRYSYNRLVVLDERYKCPIQDFMAFDPSLVTKRVSQFPNQRRLSL